ncbi:hypothetical protein H0H93_002883 [Arthromyces matolae]|nr:hypothetical protein H0H93_002883 [Arthromyces matolae]
MKDTSGQNSSTNNPTPPIIHYDEAGNPVFQDNTGRFVPYYGQFPVYPPGLPIPHPSTARDIPSLTPSASHPPPVASPADWILPPPLPDDSDEDLIDGPTVAKAQGHAPAKKVGGVRLKDKGKQKASASSSKGKQRASAPESSRKRKVVDISSDDENDDPDPKRGRPRGAGNYHSQDVTTLLDAVEAELPLGQRGWGSVERVYNKWARINKRPTRTAKSIETKFKQLVKTRMPTGDAYCPPEVKRAHSIEELINERACTRDLDDDDFEDNRKEKSGSEDSDDEVEVVETPAPSKRSAIVRRHDPLAASVSRRNNRTASIDLVTKLGSAFDPVTIKARDAERADRSFANTQLLTLSQQLRDAQHTNDSLRSQVSDLQDRLHRAERALDRVELEARMQDLARHPTLTPTRDHFYDTPRYRHKIDFDDHRGRQRASWSTEPSSDKENIPPYVRRHRSISPNEHKNSECDLSIRPPSPNDTLNIPHFSAGVPKDKDEANWGAPTATKSLENGHDNDD